MDDLKGDVVGAYVALSNPERAKLRSSISDFQASALLAFAEASARQAVRKHAPDEVVQGLIALAMEGLRTDARKTVTMLCLLYNSAVRLGLDPHEIFTSNKGLGDARFDELVGAYLARGDKRLNSMGYREVLVPEFDYVFDMSVVPGYRTKQRATLRLKG